VIVWVQTALRVNDDVLVRPLMVSMTVIEMA
jgi:hypothetical protein